MDKETILTFIKANYDYLSSNYNISKIGLIGSLRIPHSELVILNYQFPA